MRSLGGLLIALTGFVFLFLSRRFDPSVPLARRPVVLFAVLQIAAGLAYLGAVRFSLRRREASLALIIGVGVTMRAFALASVPILEDDFNRYLWDGAVTASGLDPYSFSPSQALEGKVRLPSSLIEESLSAGPVLSRVNHPRLTTIYPPVAQAAFFLAHAIGPFRLGALRAVLLVFDVASALLLWKLLAALALPPGAIAIWWWNPLLVKESVNAAHMDVLLVPFLLGALLLAARQKPRLAAVCLAFATGVKLWPVLLAPLILAPGLRGERRRLGALGIYAALLALLLAPMAAHIAQQHSGLSAYAGSWAKNGAFFPALALLFGLPVRGVTARVVVAALLAVIAVLLARGASDDAAGIVRRCGVLTAALFLVLPAPFPWYFTWLLPFLALAPSGLLALTALLPAYYLSFAFESGGRGEVFDRIVVFLEWAPVWAFVLVQAYRHRDSLGARWLRGVEVR